MEDFLIGLSSWLQGTESHLKLAWAKKNIYWMKNEASKERVKNWPKSQGLHIGGVLSLSLVSVSLGWQTSYSSSSSVWRGICHIPLLEFYFMGASVPERADCLFPILA